MDTYQAADNVADEVSRLLLPIGDPEEFPEIFHFELLDPTTVFFVQ